MARGLTAPPQKPEGTPAAAAASVATRLRDVARALRTRVRAARLRREVARDPQDTGALSRLAACYEAAGLRAEAVTAYEQLAAVYRSRPDANGLAFLARKLELLGAGGLSRVYRDLARLYGELGRHADAARACRKVVEAYLAEGHAKAAAGFVAQLPPLGMLEPETREALERLLASGSEEPARSPAAARPGPAASAEAEIFLAGTLGRIGVFDVVQIVESNGLTGRLVVDAGDARGASALHFDRGRIVAARFGSLSGAEAARRVLQLDTGPFRVELDEEAHDDELGLSNNTGFLLDMLRVIDEEGRDVARDPYATSPLVESA